MKNETRIGLAIRRLRMERGWTQHYLASRLSVSIPAICKIEVGQTDINLSRLIEIAAAFGLSAAQLVDYGKSPAREQLSAAEIEIRIRERDQEISALQREVIELYGKLESKALIRQERRPKRPS